MCIQKIYFNVINLISNYIKNDLQNIINMIHYDELEIQKGVVVPYILMSPYSKNLKKYKQDKGEIKEEDFTYLAEFLFSTLTLIHKKGIIHRDIKPENILVDEEEKLVLTDFWNCTF